MLQAWIERNISADLTDVRVRDVTDDLAILNIQGPMSRNVLTKLLCPNSHPRPEDEVSNQNFPFSTHMQNLVLSNGVQVSVSRLTYVGENGYEIYAPMDRSDQVLDLILNVSDEVRLAGMEAMSGMSMEKNFKHWHTDIAVTDNPLESRMKFACKSQPEFLGQKALQSLMRGEPIKRRLMTFTVSPSVFANGNEIIYKDGKIAGYVARAGFGHTVQKGLLAGYVSLDDGESPLDVVQNSRFEIEVMGVLQPATAHLNAVLPGKEYTLM